MNSEYITLTRKDQDFSNYLLGTFSATQVAIPVESFGVGSDRERVTFKILPMSSVERPSWFKVYYRSIRPELLGLTLGHSLVAVLSVIFLFSKNQISISLNAFDFILVTVLTLLGVVFAHASGCLFNDFRDHMKGVDRKSTSKGSQVIQRGWCRAVDVRAWAFVNAIFAAIIGLYIFFDQPGLFAILLSLSAVAILLHSWMIPFWNRFGAGDFWITFLFGPLLFFSVGLAVLSPLHLKFKHYPIEFWQDFLILSVALGLMASWTLQVRQLQGIFKMTSEGFRTVIARFSFDQAKKFLVMEGVIFAMIQAMVVYFMWPSVKVFLVMSLIFPMMGYFNLKLFQIKSPLSSDMGNLGSRALRIHGTLLLLWVCSLWIH